MTLDFLLYFLDAALAAFYWLGDAIAWLGRNGILAGAAAAAAALIAWQAHRRELTRIEEREDAADARIAGLAYVVRRTLLKSLEDPWLPGDGQTRQVRAREIRGGFDEHEPRVEDMLAEAARASPEVAADVRYFSRLFWSAADDISDAADAPLEAAVMYERYGDIAEYALPDDALNGFKQAKSTVGKCVGILGKLAEPIEQATPTETRE